jgi:hypothetical protein
MKNVVSIVLILIVCLPTVGFGDVPHQINYQGYLTDDLGNPLDGDYAMIFTIYNADTGGKVLWGEKQTVSVTNGVYDVILGQPGNDIDPADMDGELFLGVSVGSDDEMTPRQPITATAFAMKAAIADSVVDGAVTTIMIADDAVTSAKITNNSLTSADLASNSVTASQIATGAVGASEIADGAVTAADLADDYVNTSGDTITGDLTINGDLNLPNGMIRSGGSTLLHSFGTNFFAGDNAGNTTMTGYYNTAMGFVALSSNATGNRNTANGSYALTSNTSGDYNTASGYTALYSSTTGSSNTASGYRALYSNTTANNNTAVGRSALYAQNFSNGNTAWDSNNTAVGYNALHDNAPTASYNGNDNTALGASSLENNTIGNKNTASGSEALFSNTTGIYNTASGSESLFSNTTGDRNTAHGTLALYSNTTGYNNIAIGFRALYGNTSGRENTACGYWTLSTNTNGYENTSSGYMALNSNTTGARNTAIGSHADVASGDLYNATAIGFDATVDASNRVRIGNGAVSQIGGNVAWSNLSDRRGKADIEDIPLGLEFIRALKPVVFTLKNGNGRLDLGFIAQDIEELIGTDYNLLGIGAAEERKLSLRYTDFIAPMVKAIQQQQEIIDSQDALLHQLQDEQTALKHRLAKLEALLIEGVE